MLDTQCVTQKTDTGVFGFLPLFLVQLLLELLSCHCFAFCKLGRNVGSFKRLDRFANVSVGHGVDVFEEGDEGDEFCILDVAFPWFEYYGIFGLFLGVCRLGIDHDYF